MSNCYRCSFLKKTMDMFCPACRGSNSLNGIKFRCHLCDGEGLEYQYPGRQGQKQTCHVCNGYGSSTTNMQKCQSCNGVGTNCNICGGKGGTIRNDKIGHELSWEAQEELELQKQQEQQEQQGPLSEFELLQQQKMDILAKEYGMVFSLQQKQAFMKGGMTLNSDVMNQKLAEKLAEKQRCQQKKTGMMMNSIQFGAQEQNEEPSEGNQESEFGPPPNILLIHDHALTLSSIKDCSSCNEKPTKGYICYLCKDFTICTNCYTRVNGNPPKQSIHTKHFLKPEMIKEWKCKKCSNFFKGNKTCFTCAKCAFFCCIPCYFNPQTADETEEEIIYEIYRPEKNVITSGELLVQVHKHPYMKQMGIKECNCCNKMPYSPGFHCTACKKFSICYDCFTNVTGKSEVPNNHPEHEITPKIRAEWQCNGCGETFKNKCSFYCEECNWNNCLICFFG